MSRLAWQRAWQNYFLPRVSVIVVLVGYWLQMPAAAGEPQRESSKLGPPEASLARARSLPHTYLFPLFLSLRRCRIITPFCHSHSQVTGAGDVDEPAEACIIACMLPSSYVAHGNIGKRKQCDEFF